MNTFPTCTTCRFMAAERDDGLTFWDEDEERSTKHHSCVRIIHGNGDAKYDKGYDGLSVEPALVTDGSGYAARLIVLPSFGCVLHEPRTTAAPPVPGGKVEP